jgi:DNA replication and repair protein RecF
MPIQSLEITDFRNLQGVKLLPSPSVNWLIGSNGSGKTSVLESLYLVSTGKSFRSNNARQYINHDSGMCRVVTRIGDHPDSPLMTHVGVERDLQSGFSVRCNGESLRRLSELARLFPVVTFLPDSVELITGDPGVRREFVDWTMFHVEHLGDYLEVFRNFTVSLQNRNKLLKCLSDGSRAVDRSAIQELDVWDEQFSRWGSALSAHRGRFVEYLVETLNAVPELLGKDCLNPSYELSKLRISYHSGWSSERSLAEQLVFQRERDLDRGSTTSGPHRFDIRILYDGVPVKEFFSRGQIKHLTSLFKIAQARLFQLTQPEGQVIFLFDDAFSELDGRHAASIIAVVRSLGIQMFVTSVEPPESKGFSTHNHDKMFHVEHGTVCPVSVPIHREHN